MTVRNPDVDAFIERATLWQEEMGQCRARVLEGKGFNER